MKYFERNITYDLYTLASLEGKNTVVEGSREKIAQNFLKVSLKIVEAVKYENFSLNPQTG